MKKTLDKLLSIVIALIMIAALLPATAFVTADEVLAAENDSVTVTGEIAGETEYTEVNAPESGKAYLITVVRNGTTHILTNNSGSVGDHTVTVSDDKITGALAYEADVLWTFDGSGNSYTIKNGDYYISIGNSLSLVTTTSTYTTLTLDDNNRIGRNNRYLRWSNGNSSWQASTTNSYNQVVLYEKSSSGGSQTVSLTLSPFVTNITSQNGTSAITETVKVGDADASSYEITWSSSDADTVTVDANGTVKGIARGSALITATLTSVNGTDLATPISASVKVNVEYSLGGTPGTNEREYPDEGAVRINKTASSDLMDDYGLSQVELDVAGVGLRPGVDVVLIVDVSNSMEWSLDNSSNTNEADKRASEGQDTKLENAMTAARTFSEIMLNDNNGTKYDNTVSFVTFAGYDRELSNSTSDQSTYVDSVMTVFTAETDYSKAKTSFDGTTLSYTSDYMLKVTDNNGDVLVNGRNRGNTNYDYAFSQASSTVTALQEAYVSKWSGEGVTDYASTGRETYIVFMTDGAPSHYNGQTAAGNTGRDYLPGRSATYNGGAYNTQALWTDYFLNNDNTYANSLYSQVDGNFYAIGFDLENGGFNTYSWDEATLVSLLENMVTDATIPVNATANAEQLEEFYRSLANLIKPAGTEAQVIDTVNTKDFTVQMASSVTGDVSGTGTTITFPDGIPCMELKTYDLYTAANATAEHPVGSRTGTTTTLEKITFSADGTEAYSDQFGESFNIMTTSDDGIVTINARYFTYTKDPTNLDANGNPTEKFVWNIGDIPDKEIALSFYVYLKGSLEGTASEGAYYTNEEATLTYIDIGGNYVADTFETPITVWKYANTDIEYYLVNKEGKPVNRVGQEVSFDLRVRIGNIQHSEFPLNKTSTGAASDYYNFNAADYLPENITDVMLYDKNAYYKVRAASGEALEPYLTISDPSDDASKDGQSGAQTTIDVQYYEHVQSGKTYDELHLTSHIAFGLRYDLVPGKILKKDIAVIDYAKPIDIDILANDASTIPSGFTASLMGYMPYDASVELDTKWPVTGDGSITPAGNNTPASGSGSFSLYTKDSKNYSHYSLTKFMNTVDKTFGAVKLVNSANAADQYYLYNEIDVMPANNIYYEDDFMAEENEDTTVGFVYTGTWTEATESGYGTNTETANNEVHGGWISQDPGLSTDTTYSDGAAHTTSTVGAKVSFNFTGTGVDVYTRTNDTSGQVRAMLYSVTDSATTLISRKTIDNYADSGNYYQIPTLSFNSLDYGTYKLVITAGKKTDGTTTRSTYYIDGIRVYNPIQNLEDDSVVASAYGEAELGATFTVVRDLLEGESAAFLDQIYKLYYISDGTKTYVKNGDEDILFVAGGTYDGEKGTFVNDVGNPIVDKDGRTISVSLVDGDPTYTVSETVITLTVPSDCEIGIEAAGSAVGDYNNTELGKVAPISEIYLDKGQSIAIQTSGDAKGYYIGIKKLDGNDATVLISNGEDEAKEITVNHTTDMYYRIIPEDEGYIHVVNGDDSGKISITKLRIAGAAVTSSTTQSVTPIDTVMAPTKLAAFLTRTVVSDAEDVTEEVTEEVTTQQTANETVLDEDDIVIENSDGFYENDDDAEASSSEVSGFMNHNQSAKKSIISKLVSILLGGIGSLFS